MKDGESGQDYFLCLLHRVLWLGANFQLRPQRCWQPIIPTAAAHVARGIRGNSTWGLQTFCCPGGAVTEESGVISFIYTGYLSPRPDDRQALSWWISALMPKKVFPIKLPEHLVRKIEVWLSGLLPKWTMQYYCMEWVSPQTKQNTPKKPKNSCTSALTFTLTPINGVNIYGEQSIRVHKGSNCQSLRIKVCLQFSFWLSFT